MLNVQISRRALRTLDFDIETRKVGFFDAGRFAPGGCEPITIAASWEDSRHVQVWAVPETGPVEMLTGFRELFDEADIVTGHYIRRFDLPVLNAAMLEHGLPLLTRKLASDTQADLRRLGGLSRSQENLAGMLQVREAKFHMADFKWRKATRLDPDGVDLAKRRAAADVRQHKAMRVALTHAGALKPARVWSP